MGHLDQAQSDSLKDMRAWRCTAHSLGARALGSQDPEQRGLGARHPAGSGAIPRMRPLT